jgi:2-methylcitrate dehydratase PrpD
MDDVSFKLAQYISGSKYEDLTSAAIASAKRSALDTMGAMLAGSTAPGIETVVEMARDGVVLKRPTWWALAIDSLSSCCLV